MSLALRAGAFALWAAAGALAGCASGPVGNARPGLFWSAQGWTVTRFTGNGSYYCTAARDNFGQDLAFVMPAGGAIGWTLTDAAHHAAPNQIYPVAMTFDPGGTMRFTGKLEGPSKLANSDLDPVTAERLGRFASVAETIAITSPVLGTLGEYSMTGSNAAIGALRRCAGGGQ